MYIGICLIFSIWLPKWLLKVTWQFFIIGPKRSYIFSNILWKFHSNRLNGSGDTLCWTIYPWYSRVLETCLALTYWFFEVLGSKSVQWVDSINQDERLQNVILSGPVTIGFENYSFQLFSLIMCVCVWVGGGGGYATPYNIYSASVKSYQYLNFDILENI